MTWTYSGDPSSSQKDEVRFLVGDTDENDQLLQDEEINYAISSEIEVIQAAISVARAIVAKFSRLADYKISDESVSYSKKSEQYRDLVESLEKKASSGSIEIFAGGITKTQKADLKNDDDAVKPIFSRNMMENYHESDYDESDC